MSLIQRLSEIQNLPTLPEIVLRIQELVMSEEGDAALLAKIIEQDPALTTKVLKVANSSFYGTTRGRISSISLAITRIGFNEIGHIALAVNFVRQFSHRSTILDYKKFWLHALTAAHFCQLIASENVNGSFLPNDKHILFLAGLLHDIGILVYDQFFHREFENIIDQALLKEESFLVSEQHTVPNEMHGAIGSFLLELWKLDLTIIAAVRFHHSPEKAPENYRKFAQVTNLIEYYLCNTILGSFEGSFQTDVENQLAEFGLTNNKVIELLRQAQHEVENSELVQALEQDTTYTHLNTI
jgi:HD-like signal output (HDOD) protein